MAGKKSEVPALRVSLRDVASSLGVSHVTVSLALRKDPRISEERRRQVEVAAARLGYRPDPMLSALSGYRQAKRPVTIRSTVAWLNQWDDPRQLHRLHEFENYYIGAKQVAETLGYRLEEFVLGNDMSGPRLQKILQTRNVRGILIPPHSGIFHLADFDWSQFSIVRFGASVKVPRAHIVTSDQTRCGALAFQRASDKGYQRIGYVSSGHFELKTKGNFKAGYLSAQDELAPLRRRLHPLMLSEEKTASDLQALKRWFKTAKPDAIISSMPHTAELLEKAGLRVPEDVAAATLSIADGHFPAGIDQNSEEIGRVGMSALGGMIHQNERGVPEYCRRVLVEGRWVDGESMPELKAARE